jgi:mannose-6-phosphate isomerase-like protein (cupin superfamily)
MGATVTRGPVSRDEALAVLASEECSAPRSWGNGPGDVYAAHEHPNDKVLFCLDGSIVFHTDDGDLALEAGDRLDLPARTRHAATVAPSGRSCLEAWAP